MLLVVNPLAGTRKVGRYLADIISIFNRADYLVQVHITAAPGDGAAVIKERAGDMDLVVCAGGDGTFNEAVSGVLSSGAATPIGYIPAGSTNDFAASLKLPGNILRAAQQIVDGTPVSYDVGRFGQRYFSYVASFGAFTRASYATPQNVKNALGHLAYVLEGIQELSQIRKVHARFELDGGEVLEGDYLFGAISNSTSVGGILTLDPKMVDMRDGKFELLLVRTPRDLIELHECIMNLTTQTYNQGVIDFRSASRIKITTDPNMSWTLDGEQEQGHETVEAVNLRRAITLIQGGAPC